MFSKGVFLLIIEKISNSNRKIYKNLLLNTVIDENTISYGAKVNDDFVAGIILAKKDKSKKNRWNIKIFFVSGFFRNSGIGSKLLNSLVNDLKNTNCENLCLNIVTSQKTFEILKDFLSKRGFENPKALTIVYRFTSDGILKSNIVKASLNSKNPFDNIDFVPIQKVPQNILKDLKSNEDITYPKGLSLFANENNLEHVNSLVAIENDKVLGWISGLLSPGNLVLYRSFYINEDQRKTALGLALFNESMKIQLTKLRGTEGICAVSVDNPRVHKFISIYFKNNFKHTKHEYEMTLNLK